MSQTEARTTVSSRARDGRSGTPPGRSSVELKDSLSAETTAFVDCFERWSARKAAAAGASIPRIRLLYSIHCHGPRKMADLAGELDVTPRNVTALVDGLEAEGLVRRTPHATDRRITLVELTCNRDRVAAQFDAYQSSVEELFSELGQQDRATLLRLLKALRARMAGPLPSPTGRHSDA
jgi:DNA-binding MarR family transcriptional regulator